MRKYRSNSLLLKETTKFCVHTTRLTFKCIYCENMFTKDTWKVARMFNADVSMAKEPSNFDGYINLNNGRKGQSNFSIKGLQ